MIPFKKAEEKGENMSNPFWKDFSPKWFKKCLNMLCCLDIHIYGVFYFLVTSKNLSYITE